MSWKTIALCSLLLSTASVAPVLIADPAPAITDYAYGAELSSAETAFRRFPLSAGMITAIQSRALADLRVFDEDNDPMPILVRSIDGDIRTNHQQLTIIPLLTDGKTSSYMLGRSADHQEWLRSLHLHWEKSATPNILPVRVEHSADQASWKILKDSELVNNFKFGNAVLKQNIIDIDNYTQRYIKLSFLEQKYPSTLESVTAYTTTAKPSDPTWISAGKLKPYPDIPGSYHFNVSKGIAPSLLKFNFNKLNTVLTGSLSTLDSESGKLRHKPATRFSAYKVTLNNNVVSSKPVNIERWLATEWLITPDADVRISDADLPEVLLAYPQYEVIFAADGDEPYTAVWGNSRTEPSTTDVAQRLQAYTQTDQQISVVNPGRILNTAGLIKLIDSRSGPWLTLLIVAALLGIVAVLAIFGYQRYQVTRR